MSDIGQIMAECDCQHSACWDRKYCMATKVDSLTAERDECWKSFVHWRKEADALTDQLEAARTDAKKAEAYAEELERDLKTCRMAQVVMDNTVAYLERERDEANEVIDKQGALLADAYGAYLDWDEVLKDRADHECKAKLAKAAEALTFFLSEHDAPNDIQDAADKARTTLAELKGEDRG